MSRTWTLVSTTWSFRKTKKALAQGVDVFIFDERHDWEFAGGNEVPSVRSSRTARTPRGVAQVTLVKHTPRRAYRAASQTFP